MRLSLTKLHRSTLAIVFVLLASSFHAFAAGAEVKDFNVPAQYPLGACKSVEEFDCIVSVGIVDPEGSYSPGTLGQDVAPSQPISQNGNRIYQGFTSWNTKLGSVVLNASLDSPVYIGCLGTCSALRIHVSTSSPLTTKVRFTFRTSWLRPMNVQMKALESNFSFQRVQGGAEWTMEGKGMPYSDYLAPSYQELLVKKETNAKADIDSTLFDFFIHHAGTTTKDSYWDPKCSDVGFSVQSHNTNETGDPTWDSKNESLIFQVFAPHFKANGDLNVGYFKYWTSNAFLDCKYPGNTLTKSPNLLIEILNEDGTQSVVTTAVSNKGGQFSFLASGFHFSSPKIIVKAAPAESKAEGPSTESTSSPAPTEPNNTKKNQNDSIKVTRFSITCIKQGVIKEIRATNPKCPKGFTLRRKSL